MTRTALVLGGTGLIGRACVELLSRDAEFERVVMAARREIPPPADHVEVAVIDYSALEDFQTTFEGVTDLFCCLGTTIKVAGSKEAFRQVDFDFVVNSAAMAAELGCQRLMVVSALGARATSSIFYNRVKGDMEDAVSALPFDAVHIMRPSLLLGEREENRPGEKLGQLASPLLSPLLCGPLKKYRPIQGRDVAAAMVEVAKQGVSGVHAHHLPLGS